MKKIVLTKGVKNWAIVIPTDAVVVEKTAAEELRTYLEKALDLKLCIVPEGEEAEHNIFVGVTEYAKKAFVEGKSKENWIIKMVGQNLILTGGEKRGDRGVIYSVYHFLEDIVGVRWWSPFEEDVLSLSELSLDEDLYMEGTPAIAYRKPYMHSGSGVPGVPHMARTRTSVISPLDDNIENGVYDPEVRKYGDFMHAGRPHHAHVVGKYFPKDEYFEKHPEWFAWNKTEGKHLKTGTLCLSNKEVQNAFLERLMEYIEEDVALAEKNGTEFPCFYSLSQDDVDDYCFCECDECAKTIKESGYSGYLIKFVNKLSREITKKYPFVKLEYLAYMHFAEPPKDDTLPDKNVITRLAHLSSDLCHGIHEKSNELYLRLLRGWSEVTKKAGSELYIWDYMYNIRTNYPLPLFYRLKDTVKAFRDYGVSGVFVETQNAFADMWDANNYVLCHLLENPDLDENVLIEDFIMRYYGKAGKYVKEYTELLKKASDKYMIRTYCVREDSPFNYIDFETACEGSRLLDLAQQAVRGEKPFETRVNWLRKPMDATILLKFFDLKRMATAAGVKFDFDREELKARVIAALEEQKTLPENQTRVGSLNNEVVFFESFEIEDEKALPVPELLKNENPEDIYQFELKNMVKFIQPYIVKAFGQSVTDDNEACGGRALKLSYDNANGYSIPYTLAPTSKEVPSARSISLTLKKNDDIVTDTRLYKEDLLLDGYHLYKVGSVSGISEQNDVRFGILGAGDISINLSGIAVNFPMDECDVYLSMKFTGELYGGCAEDENAVYFDRMIVVRKS